MVWVCSSSESSESVTLSSRSGTLRARILKFGMWFVYENKGNDPSPESQQVQSLDKAVVVIFFFLFFFNKTAILVMFQVWSGHNTKNRFFKHSRAANSAVQGQIWLKFELIQVVMVILVTSKNEEDPIKIEGATVATIQNIDFSKTNCYVPGVTRRLRKPTSWQGFSYLFKTGTRDQ